MTPALLAACALVLLASAGAHLRRPRALASGMAAHGVLPAGVRTPLAWLVVTTEAVLGVAGLVAALMGPRWLAALAGAAMAVLFGLMAAYVHAAHRRSAGAVPCACGIGEAPLGPWVTLRAALLAGLAAVAGGVAAFSSGAWGFAGRPWDELVVLACAAVTLAVSTALLPVAHTTPTGLTLVTRGGVR